MPNPQQKRVFELSHSGSSGEMCPCVIDGVEGGKVWIRVPGCEEPMTARLTGSVLGRLSGIPSEQLRGREVVVWFSDRWPRPTPIIIDFVFDEVPETPQPQDPAIPPGEVTDILVDGKRITMEADESIELRCGSSKLVFTADGKILLRGKHVTSQAGDHNVIRGAVVKIN